MKDPRELEEKLLMRWDERISLLKAREAKLVEALSWIKDGMDRSKTQSLSGTDCAEIAR